MVRVWPLQKNCAVFYGDPSKPRFEIENVIAVRTPFKIYYGKFLKTTVKSNRRCAGALSEWLEQVWINSGRRQSVIDQWGMSVFNGDFVIRPKRAGTTFSMHAFACAWDFDAPRNGFRDSTPNFAKPELLDAVVKPFEKLGGVWGGRWSKNCDGMHFQFARPF